MTPEERRTFAWVMREMRGDDGLWSVEFRGQQMDVTAEMALKICAWGGRLDFRTYRVRQ